MHGYDSYVFGHRDFYPAINRFTTIDWKAEDTYDVSPYSYAGNNPVRFRDENGDGLWDVVVGAADAITDAATMGITNQSERASYDDADDYNTGQTIGNITSIILGGLETIGGGGTAAAGGALAVAGSETLLLIPVGVGVAAKGSAMMAHGTMMMAKGAGNLAKGHKNLVEDAKKSQGKKEVTSDRQAKREAQTEKGKSKIGNSNQGTRGSHGSMKGGNKGDKHSNAEARRASEQKKADEKRRR